MATSLVSIVPFKDLCVSCSCHSDLKYHIEKNSGMIKAQVMPKLVKYTVLHFIAMKIMELTCVKIVMDFFKAS